MHPAPSRFRVLRGFDGPATDLGSQAKDLARAELGEDDEPPLRRPTTDTSAPSSPGTHLH